MHMYGATRDKKVTFRLAFLSYLCRCYLNSSFKTIFICNSIPLFSLLYYQVFLKHYLLVQL